MTSTPPAFAARTSDLASPSDKMALAQSLAEQLQAQVISTDNVRRELQQAGATTGAKKSSTPASAARTTSVPSVTRCCATHACTCAATKSVILDGTWRDSRRRQRVHELADETASTMLEFVARHPRRPPQREARHCANTTSDATPEIAAAISGSDEEWHDTHPINTSQPVADSVARPRNYVVSPSERTRRRKRQGATTPPG